MVSICVSTLYTQAFKNADHMLMEQEQSINSTCFNFRVHALATLSLLSENPPRETYIAIFSVSGCYFYQSSCFFRPQKSFFLMPLALPPSVLCSKGHLLLSDKCFMIIQGLVTIVQVFSSFSVSSPSSHLPHCAV
jgi:hypothetical protein